MYYIGFLKKDARHAMVFKSLVKPKSAGMTYFVKVIGPYPTEQEANMILRNFKAVGWHDNPVGKIDKIVSYAKRGIRAYEAFKQENPNQLRKYGMKNPAQVISHKQALQLVKKVMTYAKKLYKHEKAGVKENPGKMYHEREFRLHMRDMEKYKLGSAPYIAALARAFEHLKSYKQAEKEDKVMRMR
jgi:hypothetical protein